uniref:Macro domain-containing protein n=1 Tax=Calidris pygmaea TaxID=425635 RepID=A0A8C3JTV8_9CHAR
MLWVCYQLLLYLGRPCKPGELAELPCLWCQLLEPSHPMSVSLLGAAPHSQPFGLRGLTSPTSLVRCTTAPLKFFAEREDSCVFEAKQKFSCLIRLEEEQQQQMDEKVVNKEKRKLRYKKVLPDGVVVAVYKADLSTYPVDVVVNASNEDLKHIGGLANALLKAAGPELQEECDELVRKNGPLQPGCAVIMGAGKLPCKNVIHAVGPRWRKEEAEKCVFLLRKTVKKSLQLAEMYNHRSIALPAISGGIFGFPVELCTSSIVSSIRETLEESMGDTSLKEVHLFLSCVFLFSDAKCTSHSTALDFSAFGV